MARSGTHPFQLASEFARDRKTEKHAGAPGCGVFARKDSLVLKRILFSAMIAWAIIDAVLTARDMPTFGLKLYRFFGSFVLSMLFFGMVYLARDWISRRLHRKAKA